MVSRDPAGAPTPPLRHPAPEQPQALRIPLCEATAKKCWLYPHCQNDKLDHSSGCKVHKNALDSAYRKANNLDLKASAAKGQKVTKHKD